MVKVEFRDHYASPCKIIGNSNFVRAPVKGRNTCDKNLKTIFMDTRDHYASPCKIIGDSNFVRAPVKGEILVIKI